MGTKYIIEVEDKPFELLSEYGFTSEKLYRVKGFNSLVFDWNGLNMLTPYTEPDLEQVRREEYEKGFDAGRMLNRGKYEKGLNDAWEAARKIILSSKRGGFSIDEFAECFGRNTLKYDVLEDYSASEAVDRVRKYEQKREEIHLGDEVTFLPNNAKGIVTECHVPDVYSDNDKYAVWCGGTMEYVLKQHLTKTGRTFPEIVEVLRKMREE